MSYYVMIRHFLSLGQQVIINKQVLITFNKNNILTSFYNLRADVYIMTYMGGCGLRGHWVMSSEELKKITKKLTDIPQMTHPSINTTMWFLYNKEKKKRLLTEWVGVGGGNLKNQHQKKKKKNVE